MLCVFVELLRYRYTNLTCAVLLNDVLGDASSVKWGMVIRSGVLSSVLFSIYFDDIIIKLTLRHSDFGICIGCMFDDCILYADDILLL